MPIHKVEGGFKWGQHGHTYPTKEGAKKQEAAIFANGYKEDQKPPCVACGNLNGERCDYCR